MTRQMLRSIRVSSKDELTKRIYRYFDKVNEVPVVFRWKNKMKDFSPGESSVDQDRAR